MTSIKSIQHNNSLIMLPQDFTTNSQQKHSDNQKQLKITSDNYLPIQLATKYYRRWDCDIQIKLTQKGYFKCLQGKGIVQFQNGNIYKGSFYNGLMHGEDGEFTWSTGMKYKGNFQFNSITGKGQYTWPDGSSFEGELLEGKRHGKGDYYCAKDKSKYYGEFKNGIKHGYGLMQFNQQTSYQGYFHQGLRHGKGKMKYQSGNVYQGQWVMDKKQGYGIMNWYTQNEKYQGQWKNDVQHGLGNYYWFDGKIQYKIIKNVYKGYWENGQRNGYGAFFFSNGCKYEGYFSHSCKDGFGLVMDECGNVKLEYFEKNKLIYSIPGTGGSGSVFGIEKKDNKFDNSLSKNNTQHTEINQEKNNTSNNKMNISRTGGKILPLIKKSNVKVNQKLNNNSNNKGNKQNPNQSIISGINHDNLDSSIIEVQKQNSILKKSAINSISNCPMLLTQSNKQNNNPLQQNFYSKCSDIEFYSHPSNEPNNLPFSSSSKIPFVCKIETPIMNLLLRQNSRLKSWYKQCCTHNNSSNTSNSSSNYKDNFYTGLTIENLWKLLKDIKIIDQFITIPKLNREFFKGWKSTYEIVLPSEKKLELMKGYLFNIRDKLQQQMHSEDIKWEQYVNNENVNYSNIQWYNYYQALMLDDGTLLQEFSNNKQINLNALNDIHHPKKIILFRHFVTYLLKVAFLQTEKSLINSKVQLSEQKFSKQYKIQIERLFKSINSIYDASFRDSRTFSDNISYVSKQKTSPNVAQDYSKINQQLFNEMTRNQQNFNNQSDKTIKVRTLYELLQKFNILKQVNQKMVFMQKIQRILQSQFKQAGSLFKKQMKQHFVNLQKVIHESPLFNRILSYNLILKDFQELIYLAINRKISSSNRQDALKKYKEMIDIIKQYVKNQNQIIYLKENKSFSLKGKKSSCLKTKFNKTQKDILKEELLKRVQEQKRLQKQNEEKKLQVERQTFEKAKMEKQDFRWEQNLQDSQHDSGDFFDD